MNKPDFNWGVQRRANGVQQLATIVAFLVYPVIVLYRGLKRHTEPYLPNRFRIAMYRLKRWQQRQFVYLFFPIYPVSHFDLDKQNYAQMAPDLLTKLLAILKPRSENPQTNWDKKHARTHVEAIKAELQVRHY